METVLIVFVAVMGLVWGSFLNVIIYRTTHGTSPLSGRSKCPKCKKMIPWKYNLPLVSFLILKGRCAYCAAKISWQYPVVEFLTGILFVWWYLIGRGFFLLSDDLWMIIQPLYWLVVGMLFLTVFMTDIKYGVIPDSVNLALFSISAVYRLVLFTSGQMEKNDFINSLISLAVLLIFFLGLWFLTKERGFGLGDVKLSPALALILGWPKTLVGIMLAFIIGAVAGLGLIIISRKKFGQTVPFAPFLIVGSILALLWGNNIWSWYIGLM
ncbi:prepilin peptidase [Candidatus Collierbacteria bacterium]|nr:prepilin peptidase [Candidatus Collierbacteria bacterium]